MSKTTKKRKSKGATKKRSPLPVGSWLHWLKRTLFVALPVVALVGAWKGFRALDWVPMALVEVDLSTTLVYQNVEDVEQILDLKIGQSMLVMDVNEVKNEIERLPWIQSATVAKIWPSSLKVEVVEHEPVAFWNDSMVLNSEGKPLEKPLAEMKLAALVGPINRAEDVMSHYLQFNQMFQDYELRVNKVVMKPRGSWMIELENEMEIYLGEKDVLKRSRRVVGVLVNDQVKDKAVEYIDARYPNGVAIKFIEQETVEVENDIAA